MQHGLSKKLIYRRRSGGGERKKVGEVKKSPNICLLFQHSCSKHEVLRCLGCVCYSDNVYFRTGKCYIEK